MTGITSERLHFHNINCILGKYVRKPAIKRERWKELTRREMKSGHKFI